MCSYFYKLAAYAVSYIDLGLLSIILHPSSCFYPPLSLLCHFVFPFFSFLPLDHLVCWFPSFLWFFTPSCLTFVCISSSFRLSILPSFSPSFLHVHLFFFYSFPTLVPQPTLSVLLPLLHLTLFYSLALPMCTFRPSLMTPFLLHVLFLLPSFHISFCHYVAGPSDQDAQEEGEK